MSQDGEVEKLPDAIVDVISSVSHELRSPLTSIKGFASTLLNRWDRLDDPTKKRLISTINDDADRITRLVADLLDVSSLEADRVQLQRGRVAVDLIAAKVIDHLQEQAKGHQVSVDFSPSLPEVVADGDKIEQVLTNLIENAFKYTQGGVVTVGGRVDDSDLRVWVSDQGRGIPADQRSRVFERFFRRRDPSEVDPGGTGLGLYIVKGLVEAHGGSIWVEEVAGGGSSFVFTLPLTDS